MKMTTEYWWEFKNTGSPGDTSRGKGNLKTILQELAGWLLRTSMNGRFVISLSRDEHGSKDDAEAELMSMFDSLMEGQE